MSLSQPSGAGGEDNAKCRQGLTHNSTTRGNTEWRERKLTPRGNQGDEGDEASRRIVCTGDEDEDAAEVDVSIPTLRGRGRGTRTTEHPET